MSYDRFIKAVNLQPTDRVPANEWLDHPKFVHELTGIDPYENPREAVIKAIKLLDLDWYTGIPQKGKVNTKFKEGESKKDTGNGSYLVEWGFTGSTYKVEFPFEDEEDIYNYNPLEKSTFEERLKGYEARIKHIKDQQALVGDSCYISDLYYTTLFMWFITVYGWEPFLMAAASDPERFKNCIEWYTQMSLEYTTHFAKTDIPVFYCHDDIALTRGLVFAPEWYRENLWPNYERIFEPLKKAGKKILFVSDGNYLSLLDDLVSLGIDGFVIDHFCNIEDALKRFGGKKLICGNAHIDKLTYGTVEDVRKEVKRCMEYGHKYPGYVMKVTGDLPHNIPLDNIKAYFHYCQEYGRLK